MKNLIERLNLASKAYYNGEAMMTDVEYDKMYELLEKLEKETGVIYSNSPTQKVGAKVLNELNKVKILEQPMLSLNKCHSIEEILKFADGHSLVAMTKCDGLSMRLVYENGKLISANTRGDGEIGSDITAHASCFLNIPLCIPTKDKIIVDGEAVIKWKDFESINKNNEFKNPRNTASGTLNALDTKLVRERKLSFIAWDFILGSKAITMIERLKELVELGFEVVPYRELLTFHDDNIKEINDTLSLFSDIPCDGVVWRINNLAYGVTLGKTAHHFNWAIAWKPEIEIYETELLDIDWTMGRNGSLTPVAIFKPVNDGESIVTRASLHNLSIMKEILGAPYIYQKIEVYRANMIIPQVYCAKKEKELFPFNEGEAKVSAFFKPILTPKICPVCGQPTEIKCENNTEILFCSNLSCPGRLINRLDHFCGKKGLDIKGLSKATLEKLIEWNWIKEPADIYTLYNYREDWIEKSGFGIKSVDRILQAIEDSRQPTLNSFISALGIPLIGENHSKELIKYIDSYENLKEKIENHWDFTSIEGFAENRANAILNFDFSEADKVRQYMTFKTEEKLEIKNNLEGINVAITGTLQLYKNRTELKNIIESQGGKVINSVSKNTSYLINNNPLSDSVKNNTAKKFGIPILTEEAFNQKFLT